MCIHVIGDYIVFWFYSLYSKNCLNFLPQRKLENQARNSNIIQLGKRFLQIISFFQIHFYTEFFYSGSTTDSFLLSSLGSWGLRAAQVGRESDKLSGYKYIVCFSSVGVSTLCTVLPCTCPLKNIPNTGNPLPQFTTEVPET